MKIPHHKKPSACAGPERFKALLIVMISISILHSGFPAAAQNTELHDDDGKTRPDHLRLDRDRTRSLTELRVLQPDQHPKVLFFRIASQKARDGMRWQPWHEKFSRSMGIVGKSLGEEKFGDNDRVLEFFNRYKSTHPEHLLLLHFNGQARDPIFQAEPFFAGHWIYYNGATILEDVSATDAVTDIKVSDSRLFLTTTGRGKKYQRHEDVGLCELDDTGRPNWSRNEQVTILKVDHEQKIITVQRGRYGTKPRSFRVGHSYAAAHVTSGPWGKESNLIWYYNFSTAAPLDEDGKQAGDIFAAQLSEWFAPAGPLETFDGVEFDALRYWPRNKGNEHRGMDINADGQRDNGVFDGIQTYGVGVVKFLENLRERMGEDRLIMADGDRWYHQRGFALLNGMESEMFPTGSDANFDDWAGGINRFSFWSSNACKPVFQYIARPESETLARMRLIIAGAVLSNAGVAVNDFVPNVKNNTPSAIWDELDKGSENELGWLGRPLGPAKHLALEKPDILATVGSSRSNELRDWICPVHCTVSNDHGAIELNSRPGEDGPLRFELRDIPCDGPDLFVSATVSASPRKGYPENTARLLQAAVAGSEIEPTMDVKIIPNMSYVNEKPFTSSFYFKDLSGKHVTFRFRIEGSEQIKISKLSVHAAPDVMFRRFENGLVLANPSSHDVKLELAKIWPGERFRRIKGSPNQDPHTNNGQPARKTVTLAARDALFLIRETAGGEVQ